MKQLMAVIIALTILPLNIAKAQSTSELLDKTVQLDNQLNQKYHELQSQMTEEDFSKLKSAQIDWIKFKEKTCRLENIIQSYNQSWVIESVSGDQNLECIQRLTELRLDDLKNYLSIIKNSKVIVENCQFKNLPSEFEVYAVGKYSGITSSDYQLGNSGHSTKIIEVVVNKPNIPIVLVLMAYDPVIWKVSHTKESNVIGVVLAGYHSQALLGLPSTTPKILAIHEEKSECKYFYAYKAGKELDQAINNIKSITGQDLAELLTTPTNNKFHIGSSKINNPSSLLFSTESSISDYTNIDKFPSGQKGLDTLVELEKIRLATQSEISAWVEKASSKYQKYNQELKVSHHMRRGRTYIILDNFKLPTGLAGAHSRSFIVPVNQNLPSGPRGHNTFYHMATGKCTGAAPECRH